MSTLPKKFSSLIIPILILSSFFVLLVISELVFTLKNERQSLTSSYLSNTKVLGTSDIKDKFTALVLYDFLSSVDKAEYEKEECVPFCVDYDLSQQIVNIFKKVEKESLPPLDNEKKAKLYYYVSTLGVWNQDTKTTIGWLDKAIELDKDDKYLEFRQDLLRLDSIKLSEEARAFFVKKLEKEDYPLFQKIYLAKASSQLADIYLSGGDAEKAEVYFNKAIELNPWKVDYYLILTDIYLSQERVQESQKLLQKCVDYLKEDSGLCKDKLTLN